MSEGNQGRQAQRKRNRLLITPRGHQLCQSGAALIDWCWRWLEHPHHRRSFADHWLQHRFRPVLPRNKGFLKARLVRRNGQQHRERLLHYVNAQRHPQPRGYARRKQEPRTWRRPPSTCQETQKGQLGPQGPHQTEKVRAKRGRVHQVICRDQRLEREYPNQQTHTQIGGEWR